VDRDEVRNAVEPGGERLRGRDEEDGVGPATALRRPACPAGGLDHAGGARVDTDHQLIGPLGGPGQDEPPVAGTDVNRDRGVRRRGIGKSADVDFGEASAVEDVHRPMIIVR
jgi:hypothetical protein